MDATRISDGRIVTIKAVLKRFTPFEEKTIRQFSEQPLASDPHNHAIPLYEAMHPPWDDSVVLLIMPYLIDIHKHKFATVGEVVECFRQLFEVSFILFRRIWICHFSQGLQFMHHNLVAHW